MLFDGFCTVLAALLDSWVVLWTTAGTCKLLASNAAKVLFRVVALCRWGHLRLRWLASSDGWLTVTFCRRFESLEENLLDGCHTPGPGQILDTAQHFQALSVLHRLAWASTNM